MEAHPRSRGENPTKRKRENNDSGSSPLTRGKLRSSQSERLSGGLIPAHAGKTAYPARPPARRGAHPRSRGENAAGIASVALTQGSSPLTRGKLCEACGGERRVGLIPAHAGKTRNADDGPAGHGAHPRSRGENAGGVSVTAYDLGSSPLTRGKQHQGRLERPDVGLIPAHAGKTDRLV